MERQEFIERYSDEIYNRQAAFFVGAGLSCACGLPSWSKFLKSFAKSLNIKIDKGADLLSVAQFYVNSQRCRNLLNQHIVDAFGKNVPAHESHKLLVKLPVDVVWTTNYDTILEHAYEDQNKTPDIKSKKGDFTIKTQGCDLTLYKMHGDVRDPQNAVLTKDDYEQYPFANSIFINQLKSDLCAKTFLFLGFSMDDPNLKQVLAHLRVDMGPNPKTHYLIYKKETLENEEEKEDKQKDKKEESEEEKKKKAEERKKAEEAIRQYEHLWMEDLLRYGIQTIVIDRYEDLPDILHKINLRINNRRIFISGSFNRQTSEQRFSNQKALHFCYSLVYKIVSKGNGIITGFGAGVGNSTIKAILQYAALDRRSRIDKMLHIFPYGKTGTINDIDLLIPPDDDETQWRSYRQNSLSHSGISLFIYGEKTKKEEKEEKEDKTDASSFCSFMSFPNICKKLAPKKKGKSNSRKDELDIILKEVTQNTENLSGGMLEEFRIACEQEKHYIIPIGRTCYTAEFLGNIVSNHIDFFYPTEGIAEQDRETLEKIKKYVRLICSPNISWDGFKDASIDISDLDLKDDNVSEEDKLMSKLTDTVVETIRLIQSLRA